MTAIVKATEISAGIQWAEVFVNGIVHNTELLATPSQELVFVQALRNRYDEVIPWSCWILTRDLKREELGLAS